MTKNAQPLLPGGLQRIFGGSEGCMVVSRTVPNDKLGEWVELISAY